MATKLKTSVSVSEWKKIRATKVRSVALTDRCKATRYSQIPTPAIVAVVGTGIMYNGLAFVASLYKVVPAARRELPEVRCSRVILNMKPSAFHYSRPPT